jgi:diguanylate cyclase (GGDEF)-like protein
MLKLLERIERISACRDRDVLGVTIVAAVHELFQAHTLTLYRSLWKGDRQCVEEIASHDGSEVRYYGEGDGAEHLQAVQALPLIERAWREREPVVEEQGGEAIYVYPLLVGDSTTPYGFLCLHFIGEPSGELREGVGWFLRFFSNYLTLLDYSELDSLTGLLNRKTFDELFERVLARLPDEAASKPVTSERRRRSGAGEPHWLAVVDIDHFKRINDSFGHLFGDEVLLRLGNLMRATFRKHDLLFRFGGEEFVVVLRPKSRENAERAFERFRTAVETHEFPQVGRVTCSVGYVQVMPGMAPIDIVGRADRALYHAKENGRNKVSCFESLVAAGVLSEYAGSLPGNVDIDALFG